MVFGQKIQKKYEHFWDKNFMKGTNIPGTKNPQQNGDKFQSN